MTHPYYLLSAKLTWENVAIMASSSQILRERVLSLAPASGALAIATEAASGAGSRPGVIFLNAGVLHRIGPHRLHVTLARQLGTSGFSCLRMDLSGIGDSPPFPGTMTFRAAAVADTQAAMTGVAAAMGVQEFILFGLCSGADNAIATALVDPRVVGLVLIDPPTYANAASRWRSLVARARRHRGLSGLGATLLSAGITRLRKSAAAMAARAARRARTEPADGEQGRQYPPREEYGAQLDTLLRRNVRILSLYSGVLGDRYNHRDQLLETFPALGDRMAYRWFPESNHVFTELAQRQQLISCVTQWIEKEFGSR